MQSLPEGGSIEPPQSSNTAHTPGSSSTLVPVPQFNLLIQQMAAVQDLLASLS